jgi:hypothetical protein
MGTKMDTAAIHLRLPSFKRLAMLFLHRGLCVSKTHKSPITTGLFPLYVELSVAVEPISLFGPTGGKKGKILIVVLTRMSI